MGEVLKSHWETLCACDFFSVEALSAFGTVRHMVFFVMEIKTRVVHIAGIRIDPDGAWMKQIARNLTDPIDGILRGGGYLVHDRDPVFTAAWSKCLREAGVKCVRIPAQSPNCNPYAERFVRTIRQECLQHFVIFGEAHLRHVVGEFVAHYNGERYHQGLGGRLLAPKTVTGNDEGQARAIKTRSRLGGTLNFYHREAA